jgi:hypothetical protein
MLALVNGTAVTVEGLLNSVIFKEAEEFIKVYTGTKLSIDEYSSFHYTD